MLEHDIFKIVREKAIHASTKLFVTMTPDTDVVTDEHREHRIDWCIDNQFEFVHFGMSNPIDGMSDAVGTTFCSNVESTDEQTAVDAGGSSQGGKSARRTVYRDWWKRWGRPCGGQWR